MNEKKCVRLHTNMLAQNVYVRDCVRAVDLGLPPCIQYPELERKDTDFGFEERVVIRDYPITPESVSSFAETADYKNNLVEALNAPSRGKGLGDIRDIQDLQNMDSFEIQKRITELQKVLAQKPVPAPAPASENKDEGDKK